MFSRQKPTVEDSFVGPDTKSLRRAEFAPTAPAPSVNAPMDPIEHRKATVAPSGRPSYFSSDLTITGAVMTDGAVEVQGVVDGTIYAREVLIGAGAQMKGDVVAEKAVIDGPASGRVTARTVHLKAHARFRGDIIHQKLIIDEGAEFEGAVHRKVDEAAWVEISRTFEAPGVELTADAARAVDALKKEFLKF